MKEHTYKLKLLSSYKWYLNDYLLSMFIKSSLSRKIKRVRDILCQIASQIKSTPQRC